MMIVFNTLKKENKSFKMVAILNRKWNLATWIRKCQQMPKKAVFFIQRDIISTQIV